METAILVVLLVGLLGFGWFAFSSKQGLSQLRQEVDSRLSSVSNSLIDSLTKTGSTLKEVGDKTGQLLKATENVQALGSQIATFQGDLQKIFLQTHELGEFGEAVMERLLEDTLPAGSFTLQHAFHSGGTVDAAIRVGDKLVPVDSKFPLQSYKNLISSDAADKTAAKRQFVRDIRGHMEKIKGYIRPEEGTFEFAMMFIPSEAVFLEIVKDQELLAAARRAGVVPCCSHTFFAYLQAVALGLKGYQLQESAKQVLAQIGQLQQDFRAFSTEFDVLGTHISHGWNKYFQELKPGLQGLDGRVSSLLRVPQVQVGEGQTGQVQTVGTVAELSESRQNLVTIEPSALPAPRRRGRPRKTP